MKELLVLTISFFWITLSYGQVGPIEGSLAIQQDDDKGLSTFEQFVNSILAHDRDSLMLDSIPREYRLVYSTSCYYSEYWKDNGCTFGTQGKSFMDHQTSTIQTLTTDAMFSIHKAPFICAENPVTFKEVELTFVLEGGQLTNADETSQVDIDLLPPYGWWYTPKMSYDSGRFLILETTILESTEEELKPGVTTSYFLEWIR